MHLFKRTRTPPELVLKACNNYEDLGRSATNQSVRTHNSTVNVVGSVATRVA
jgi:hypothetical protein